MFVTAHAAVMLLNSTFADTWQRAFSIRIYLFQTLWLDSLLMHFSQSVLTQSLCMIFHLQYRYELTVIHAMLELTWICDTAVVLGDTRNFMPQYLRWKSIAILDTIAIPDRAYH